MKPSKVWLVKDQYGDFFISIGEKPSKERWGRAMKYAYTLIEDDKVKVYVASDAAQKTLAKLWGKGMRRDTCRRLA